MLCVCCSPRFVAQLKLSIISVDAARVAERHGTMQARGACTARARSRNACLLTPACVLAAPPFAQPMLVKWSAMLAEGGLRGKHITLERAGASQASALPVRLCRRLI